MKKGKFEAVRSPAEQTPEPRTRGWRRWFWLPIAAAVLAAAVFAGLWFFRTAQANEDATASGLTAEETLERFRQMAATLERTDLVLTLNPDDPDSGEEPFVLTISPRTSRVQVDLGGVEQDLANQVGKVSRKRYVLDPADYVSLDLSVLREMSRLLAEDCQQTYVASYAVFSTRREGNREGEDLNVNVGRVGRTISAEAIYQTLLDAYYTGNLTPELTYQVKTPAPLDAEAVWESRYTAPTDAVLNEETFAITPEVPGYGFQLAELQYLLANAEPGRAYMLALRSIPAAVTTKDIEDVLYANVLAEAHTPHSWVDDRTHNLELACAAIDGTVVMPGEIFSFNETVGERTEEKGYREAMAYIAGYTVPEIGGGVCQVASSIYYAVLQADLKTVERHVHTYLVTYVPQGMDAAIYWGKLDYRFENTSSYPIRIDASVSDGSVHILLRGREWKDYTVKVGFEVMEEIPYETVERVVYDSEKYKTGDTIISPYTGYLIETFKGVYNSEGKFVEKVHIAYSRYAKRDKVVAVVKPKPQSTGDD